MGAPRHPARYSRELLPHLADALEGVGGLVVDQFAGTGERLAELAAMVPDCRFVGVEIQPRWAAVTPELVRVGNALALPFDDGDVDAIITSPTYGNRLADHHHNRDGSRRRSYHHDHGEPLDPDNSGTLHWGPEYRDFHQRAWKEAARVVRPGGRFVLNISDHIRKGVRQPVTAWHVGELARQGFRFDYTQPVPTRRLRHGDNAAARVACEYVIRLTRT